MTEYRQKFADFRLWPVAVQALTWLNAANGLIWLGLIVSAGTQMGWPVVPILLVCVLNIFSAWRLLNYRISGLYAAAAVYLSALFVWRTDGFVFDLTGLLRLTFGFGLNGWFLALNFIALLSLIVAVQGIRNFQAASQRRAEPRRQSRFERRFPEFALMSLSGQAVAWLTLIQVLGLLSMFAAALIYVAIPWYFVLMNVLVVALTVRTAWLLFAAPLNGLRWAFLVYLLGVFAFAGDAGFAWDFRGVLNWSVGFGWFDGGFFQFNLAAVLMLFLIYRSIMAWKQQAHAANPDVPEEQI